jgi:hypothetical protein
MLPLESVGLMVASPSSRASQKSIVLTKISARTIPAEATVTMMPETTIVTVHMTPCTAAVDFGTPQANDCPRNPHGPKLACPDCNCRPFLPDVQCNACMHVGHVARHCDMLATAICLKRYIKKDLLPAIRDLIEQDWLSCWKERLGNPDSTPRQVLHAYIEELDIMIACLDDAMEWSCWDNDDNGNPNE